ncbi:MAG TPA: hypothetical protein VIL24_04210 [Clostridia bacterium]
MDANYYFLSIKDSDFDIFFKTLTKNQQREFVWWFVYEPGKPKSDINLYINKQDNRAFFIDFVRLCPLYKHKLSVGLMFKMLEFAKFNYFEPKDYSYVEDRQIKLFYSLKNNPIARKICKDLCYEKIQKAQKNSGVFLKVLIALESEDNLQEAINLCHRALRLDLDEATKNSFLKLLQRLESKAPTQS